MEFAIETSEDGRAKAISVSGPEGSFVQVCLPCGLFGAETSFFPRRPTNYAQWRQCESVVYAWVTDSESGPERLCKTLHQLTLCVDTCGGRALPGA